MLAVGFVNVRNPTESEEHNVIHGNGDNTFKPEKICTKAEMAMMIYNMIKSVKDGVFYEH